MSLTQNEIGSLVPQTRENKGADMKVYKGDLGQIVFSDDMHTTERFGPECWIDPNDTDSPKTCHEEADPNDWEVFIAWCKQEGLEPRKADSVRQYMKLVDA